MGATADEAAMTAFWIVFGATFWLFFRILEYLRDRGWVDRFLRYYVHGFAFLARTSRRHWWFLPFAVFR